MKKLTSVSILAVIALLMQFTATNASASFIGNSLQIEWHFSSLGTVISSETPVVGAGLEFVERFGGPNIDVAANTIDFFGANAPSFSTAAFNGFVFTDISNSLNDFLSVSISSQTGYTSFDLSDINVTANSIAVNFQNVGSVVDPNQLQLSVIFAGDTLPDQVPEPGTLALLGLGLVGMSIRKRCKKNA